MDEGFEFVEQKDTNIYFYPKPEDINSFSALSINEITLGDLHANLMLMMYFLVVHQIVVITPEKYAELAAIYIKSPLEAEDIRAFNSIIDNLIINKRTLLRFLGDEICDRGQNDYFIFKLLDKLKREGLQFEILFSNHGESFVNTYLKNQDPWLSEHVNPACSLKGMNLSIAQGLITREQIKHLVDTSYIPSLKLLSYTLDLENNSILIGSHAPIGLETIKAMAGAAYKDNTINQLAETIDLINHAFRKLLYKHELGQTLRPAHLPLIYQIDPIFFSIWNRTYTNLDRPNKKFGYNICYMHGHDSQDPLSGFVYNLDGYLGKGPHSASSISNENTYKVLLHKGLPPVACSYEAHFRKRSEMIYKQFLTRFSEIELKNLKRKVRKIDRVQFPEAYKTGKKLIARLTHLINDFKKAESIASWESVKKQCLSAIEMARPDLEETLSQLDQLKNILKTVLNFICNIVTLGYAHHFFKPEKAEVVRAMDGFEANMSFSAA